MGGGAEGGRDEGGRGQGYLDIIKIILTEESSVMALFDIYDPDMSLLYA